MGRTKNSFKNATISFSCQTANILCSFISRKVFILFLSSQYLGINGLFSNLLTLLSFAELGFGTAIIYSLYKPLAMNDCQKIASLMKFYKKIYIKIGFVVLISGLSIYLFLDFIIKDKPDIPYINQYYLLFLLNSVVSYFFSYKKSLLSADQKNYILTLFRYGSLILLNITQIILLYITHNYALFLLAQIVFTLCENWLVSKKVSKIYPYINNKNNKLLDTESKFEIYKNVKALVLHKIGGIVLNGTDNIVISSIISVYWVGLYSNYYLIVYALQSIIGQFFNSITACFGNYNAVESSEKSYNLFKITFFINFCIITFCSITLLVIIQPFIKLWIGETYLLHNSVVIIIVINFFIMGMRNALMMYRNSLGLFWHDRYRPLIGALLNIVLSIILAKTLGLAGVFVATLLSYVLVSFWIEPYILYKFAFNKKLSLYFKMYFKYIFLSIFMCIITLLSCSCINLNGYKEIFFKLILCIIIPNSIILIFTHKSFEFKETIKILKRIGKR